MATEGQTPVTEVQSAKAEEQAKIKIHWLDGSRAQAVLWLLEELEVPYEIEVYHRKKTMEAPPELAKVHPLGKSPVVSMTIPGASEPVVLAESGFIFDYLCKHYAKAKNLVPKEWKDGQEGKPCGETQGWLRFRYLLFYSEGSLMPYLWLYMILTAIKAQVPFLIRPIISVVVNQVTTMLIQPTMEKNLSMLESYLATGKYMCGDHLSAADILLSYPLVAAKERISTWEFKKGVVGAKAFPKVFEYLERLEAEAGWNRAADKIRKLEGTFYVTPKGLPGSGK